MQRKVFSTKMMVSAGLLIAVNIVLERVFVINPTPNLRISFGFLAVALFAMCFGAVPAMIMAFFADFLGMVLFPSGAYFVPLGISAALYGLTFGLFLYKRRKTYMQIILCILVQTIFIDLLLNSFWLNMLNHNPYLAILGTRAVKAAIMFPVKAVTIKLVWDYIGIKIYKRQCI